MISHNLTKFTKILIIINFEETGFGEILMDIVIIDGKIGW